ncbi:pentapeptide repeat-containing protein [uncultured Tateyamaria sp.]|uniref:pentapeptide repeat-containing protein n=1 Tax=uncultured Tateyamaria sp. TaxID=455651 RepID=UPI00261BB588|nr:pentapeptide repeat-containing protein [uncultured Tateyamaria sp.]
MTSAPTFSDQLPEPLFWGLLALAGATVAGIAVHLIWSNFVSPKGKSIASQFGLPNLHNVAFVIAVLLWSALTLLLTSSLFGLILATLELSGNNRDDLFYVLRIGGLTAVLGAVIALPFTVIRLRLTQDQTDTARDSLFNDKINEATKGLYARRQVTLGEGAEAKDHWQDDIVQRNAAIDRLEGLAHEKPTEVPRIARLLSVYVRELSVEVPAQDPPKDATPNELQKWATELPKLRSDMEKAAQTLGRLEGIAPGLLAARTIDLHGANLQNADLENANFTRAHLEEARLQGSSLHKTVLKQSDLYRAQLQAADLHSANLQEADLAEAQLFATEGVDSAFFQGASVKGCDFSDVPEITSHLKSMFGDTSVLLPLDLRSDDDEWPSDWLKEDVKWDDFLEEWRKWRNTPSKEG